MEILAKLSAGDVVAQEFKYHPACLVGLYNRERDHLDALHKSRASKAALARTGITQLFQNLSSI